VASAQQLGEVGSGDGATQPEVRRPLPFPQTGRFAGQPRSLGPPGHEVVDVIGVAATMEDVDPEQPAPRSQPADASTGSFLRPLLDAPVDCRSSSQPIVAAAPMLYLYVDPRQGRCLNRGKPA
jgi:hypothetical protein